MVSSKKGPSSGSGLSKRTSVWSPPAVSRPSNATSRPGMNSSTSSASASSPLRPTSSRARIAAIRRNAATKPSGAPGEAREGLRGAVRVGEVDGDQVVRRALLEGAGALGGADQIDAEPGGGVDEGLRPIGGGRQEQQEPRHGVRHGISRRRAGARP